MATQNGQVTASTLNLRTEPNTTTGIVIDSFPSGTSVEIIRSVTGDDYSTSAGSRTDWYEIKVNGKQGYVAAFYIAVVDKSSNKILDAIFKVNAEHPYYKARDITGDGIKETFCNWFVADVLDKLGISLPRLDASAGSYPEPHPIYGFDTPFKPFAAEALFKFFVRENSSPTGKWKELTTNSAAVLEAQKDHVVVASYPGRTTSPRKQGHIAIIRPDSSASNIIIAQAGRISSNNLPLTSGFGSVISETKFFTFTD